MKDAASKIQLPSLVLRNQVLQLFGKKAHMELPYLLSFKYFNLNRQDS